LLVLAFQLPLILVPDLLQFHLETSLAFQDSLAVFLGKGYALQSATFATSLFLILQVAWHDSHQQLNNTQIAIKSKNIQMLILSRQPQLEECLFANLFLFAHFGWTFFLLSIGIIAKQSR
jgi:hypothetical protein